MFGKGKIKNVTISTNDEYVIWNVDLTGIVRGTTLEVKQGCLGIYVVNGKLQSTNTPGRWVIKTKEEEKSGYSLQLLGVNADKTYDILCGIGGIPFKDMEINAETQVGLNGEVRIRLVNPWMLYIALGKQNVTIGDVDEYIRSKISELMSTRLATVLQKYDYQSVNTQASKIADDLKKLMDEEFANYGIGIESFALKKIYFNDEYVAKRSEFFDNQNRKKEEKDAQRAAERAQRAEIDAINSLIGAAPVQAPAPAPVQNTDLNQPVQYCPRCGMKINSAAKFCPGCGKQL